MTSDKRTDLSHLPPSTPEEIRAMARNAGLDLPDELMRQFIAAWPNYEAMIRRWVRNVAVLGVGTVLVFVLWLLVLALGCRLLRS